MVEEIERVYTVPLGKAYLTVRGKRARRAVKILKGFLAKHMKTEEERVKLSKEVNSLLWSRGIKKPPRRIKVKAKRDAKGEVSVSLVEEPKEEKKG
ncbi:MAG: 50S ribosomal protein L31e [Candidatus Micrarchaeia archaeon]